MKHKRFTVRLMVLALCVALMAPAALSEGGVRRSASPRWRAGTTLVRVAQPAVASGERADLAAEVARQVNIERAKAGLSPLRTDAELTRAARVRALEIVRKFSHTRPDGSAWRTVSASVYGENIAMGQRTADKVMAAWLTSAGHRANIMRPSFGSIGVCCVVSGGVTYWAQLFGK